MSFQVELGEDEVPFVDLGVCTLRLDLEDLDEEYKEMAREELRETPENVEGALVALRGLIKGMPVYFVTQSVLNYTFVSQGYRG